MFFADYILILFFWIASYIRNNKQTIHAKEKLMGEFYNTKLMKSRGIKGGAEFSNLGWGKGRKLVFANIIWVRGPTYDKL